MKYVIILSLFTISMNASAYQFEPELIAEINRVIPIYKKALASPDELICGLKNGEKIKKIDEIACPNTKRSIKSELECLKNSFKLVKTNPYEIQPGMNAFVFFQDNENYTCFEESYPFSSNRFGTEVGEARMQFYQTLKKHPFAR